MMNRLQFYFSVLFLAIGFLVHPSVSQSGVCSRTRYRRVETSPASMTGYTTVAYYDSYSCGFLWLSRCRRVNGYRRGTVTKYVTAYRSQSYRYTYCCTGYTGSPPNCERVSCPVLRDPSYGDVSYSSRRYQDVARYSCDTGYELSGSSQRTCQSTGRWSGSNPTCRAIICPTPSKPSGGSVSYTSTRYNGVAHYSCNTGYRLVGSAVRTCQLSGRWSGSQPSCQVITCPTISDPQDGSVSYTSRQYNSVARYSCDSGYVLVGSWTRTCQESGSWSGSQPTCPRRPCPVLQNPSNGNVRYSSHVYQDVAHYDCNIGYVLRGSSQRTCQANGQWSGLLPSCRPVICRTPSTPANGSVSYTSTRYNGAAHYSCDSGFRLVGSRTLRCLQSGSWSDSEPTCERISCPSPPPPTNGGVSVSSLYPGGVATYACDYGYRITDLFLRRECQVNGEWTGTEPSCEVIRCEALDEPENGTMRMVSYGVGLDNSTTIITSYGVGAVVVFNCAPTHFLVGSEQRTCGENEQWDGTQPTCHERCTPYIGFVLEHLRIEEGETKRVCLRACNYCDITSNLTVEIKARSQEDGSILDRGVQIPDEITIQQNLTCFDVHLVDNDVIEGFEAMSILLFNPGTENYGICQDSSILSVALVDDDELTIGFENDTIIVDEDTGSVEVCVVVYNPKNSIPIPDVVLMVDPLYFVEPRAGEDYRLGSQTLALSDIHRRTCFTITVIDDTKFEEDEKLEIIISRVASEQHQFVDVLFEPALFTMTILDNEGVAAGFETHELLVREGEDREVCIKPRFSTTDNVKPFFLEINTHSLTAEPGPGNDYEAITKHQLGPFSPSSSILCFTLNIHTDCEREEVEYFALNISGEPSYVMVAQRTLLVKIDTDKEAPLPCNHFLRNLYPCIFTHCTDCKYLEKNNCSNWEELPHRKVKVHSAICTSEEMYVKTCSSNATEGTNCKPKVYLQTVCNETVGQKLVKELGAGNVDNKPANGRVQTTDSPLRKKRSVGSGTHCYAPDDALSLNIQQCDVTSGLRCPYANNKIRSRDPNFLCTNRSVLFIVDSSQSVGYHLFREISVSLSNFVGHLCGDVQFGLIKYSNEAYLEFCFDCFSNNERGKLQDRIFRTKFVEGASLTGYATRCANSFMFDGSTTCGTHDGRCIDIVFVTDGQSSDRAFINVCDQVKCLHQNPHISDMLKVYAVNVGTNGRDEAECITKHTKLRNGEAPIFNFNSIDDLLKELNTMIRQFSIEEHRFRSSGKKPHYQCRDWLKENTFN